MKIENNDKFTMIKCSHVERFEGMTNDQRKSGLKGAAPGMHGIELEPAVLFMCCSWCAAFVRQNAIKDLVKSGVTITLEPPGVQEEKWTWKDTLFLVVTLICALVFIILFTILSSKFEMSHQLGL